MEIRLKPEGEKYWGAGGEPMKSTKTKRNLVLWLHAPPFIAKINIGESRWVRRQG
jgi:hypothetical protein